MHQPTVQQAVHSEQEESGSQYIHIIASVHTRVTHQLFVFFLQRPFFLSHEHLSESKLLDCYKKKLDNDYLQ